MAAMVKSYNVLLPEDFPGSLVSFQFFFENYDSHIMNLYHAAGMNLVYELARACYAWPQHELYQLWLLENTQEQHLKKYEVLLMKGSFAGPPAIETRILVMHDGDAWDEETPPPFVGRRLRLHRLPEPGDDLVIADEARPGVIHHLRCTAVIPAPHRAGGPLIRTSYIATRYTLLEVINGWLDEDHRLRSLSR